MYKVSGGGVLLLGLLMPIMTTCTWAMSLDCAFHANVWCAKLTRHPEANKGLNRLATGCPCTTEFVDTNANDADGL